MKGFMEILSGDGFGDRRPREGGRAGAGVILGFAIAETEWRKGKRRRTERIWERCIIDFVQECRRVEEANVRGGSVV